MKEMEMICECNKPKNGNKIKCFHGGPRIPLNSDAVLVVKIPDVQILRIMSRSLFLAMSLVTLPFLGSILKGLSSSSASSSSSSSSGFSHSSVYPIFDTDPPVINGVLLNFLLHDLADEGLLRKDDKALVITPPSGFVDVVVPFSNEVEVVLDSDLERKVSIPNEAYDFVFISTSEDAEFVDRILKFDGIVALPLGTNPSNAFKEKPNYRVVYLRTYSSIIVALRKTDPESSSSKRKLCQLEKGSKKVVLNGLEDVFLEPPKKALVKSNKYLKKIKYLPNLMGNSIEAYKRRVFIVVGLPQENKGTIEWFKKNYPKSQHFEVHNLETEPKDRSARQTDVSAWLTKHVKEQDFVVMKAEAEAVEEMIKKRTICIVDELFLECKNEWWKSGKKRKNNHRAYWECLALYGRLRDEGVAVHQWWG